jgi:hypothetical protein
MSRAILLFIPPGTPSTDCEVYMQSSPTAFRHIFIVPAFFVAFGFSCVASALAQTPADLERARIRAERDLANREWMLRNIGKVKRVDVDIAPPQIPLAKVKEDYEGLQAANNNILKMLSVSKELDYKVIGDAAAQIRKRAARLKSYLITLQLVEDEEDDRRRRSSDAIEPYEMKASLLSLDASIASLISNSVFKDFGKVVDAGSSARARTDLLDIIELSERIKKTVERSMKSTRASR